MTSELKNDLFLRALRGEKTPRTPVWMMRQAGRYLPEYIRLREKYGFFERVQTPELAAAITLQPVDLIGVDAAILFSDILVVPQSMGLEVQLIENRGPVLPEPVRGWEDLKRIRVPEVRESLAYVFDAIRLTKQGLDNRAPLIGFAGAPWTILCYMVQGRGSKTFDEAKAFCYQEPELARQILQLITDTTLAYLKGQAEAGADVLQIFDSWGGLLGKDDFEALSLPYIRQLAEGLKARCPLIVFAKGAWHSLGALADTGAMGLGLDWCIEPEMARRFSGDSVALQGNFDPAKLLSPIPSIEKEVAKMLRGFGRDRYIANLGHGILPNTPVAHAKAFVETVKNFQWENA